MTEQKRSACWREIKIMSSDKQLAKYLKQKHVWCFTENLDSSFTEQDGRQAFSQIIDIDNWSLNRLTFFHSDALWGPHTVDRQKHVWCFIENLDSLFTEQDS